MSDDLHGGSIQNWLASFPQGHLQNTGFGHEIEKPRRERSYPMLATLSSVFGRSAAVVGGMEAVLADTVCKEFKTRLAHIGIGYRTAEAPHR